MWLFGQLMDPQVAEVRQRVEMLQSEFVGVRIFAGIAFIWVMALAAAVFGFWQRLSKQLQGLEAKLDEIQQRLPGQ
jgi:hypothetical protein